MLSLCSIVVVQSRAHFRQIWWSVSSNLVLIFVTSGARFVLYMVVVQSGHFREIWCSFSSNLVLIVVISGARFALYGCGPIWCSCSSNLVLMFVKSGAHFRQIWCLFASNLVLIGMNVLYLVLIFGKDLCSLVVDSGGLAGELQ